MKMPSLTLVRFECDSQHTIVNTKDLAEFTQDKQLKALHRQPVKVLARFEGQFLDAEVVGVSGNNTIQYEWTRVITEAEESGGECIYGGEWRRVEESGGECIYSFTIIAGLRSSPKPKLQNLIAN
jgi:hypothetical protein